MIPLQKNELVRKPIEAGWYNAILRQVIYVGKQKFGKDNIDKDGKVFRAEWWSPQIVLGFELPTIIFENQKTGEKFTKVMSMTVFASLNPSRSGVGFYEVASTLGGLDSDNPDAFDEKTLVGKSCDVKIASVISKGRAYDNIVEIRKSEPEYEGMRENVSFGLESFSDIFLIEAFPEWIKNKIYSSEEYIALSKKQDSGEIEYAEFKIDNVPF